MISVKNLSHSFDEKQVLFDVSLNLDPGEIVVIMGSSGGGKTTLLKCIAGLLTPTEGEIAIDDVDMIGKPDEARQKLGLVFQYAALFDYLNVADNITFGIDRRVKMGKEEKKEFVAQRLAEVGMSDTEKLMPSELSGGMRKRVGLARALAMSPSYLLYDEPTSGLDPVTAYSIDQLIVSIRDRTGAASIVVSHDVSSVFRVADRILFLDQGKAVFDGSPDEFRASSLASISDLVERAGAESLS